MGVLKQKCVLSYESFLNNSNLSNREFNVSYHSYLNAIDNNSMCEIVFFVLFCFVIERISF